MRQVRLLPLLMSVALAIPLAATAADPYVPLQQRMTPEEFKAAGLDKLSPSELKNLDAWLSGHGKVVTKLVDQSGKPVFYPASEKAGDGGKTESTATSTKSDAPSASAGGCGDSCACH